jgi:hypothetical protein
MSLTWTRRRLARIALITAALMSTVLGTASAQARTADVYSGYSSKVGHLKSNGTRWTASQGYSDRIREVRFQGTKCIVYSGYSDRVGEVRRQGSKWIIYEGYSNRVGELRLQSSKWVVYEGYSSRTGEIRGAGVSGGCAAGGAALLLLLLVAAGPVGLADQQLTGAAACASGTLGTVRVTTVPLRRHGARPHAPRLAQRECGDARQHRPDQRVPAHALGRMVPSSSSGSRR